MEGPGGAQELSLDGHRSTQVTNTTIRDSTRSWSTHLTTSFKCDRDEQTRRFFANGGEDVGSFRKIIIADETRPEPNPRERGRLQCEFTSGLVPTPLLFQAVKPRCDWPFGEEFRVQRQDWWNWGRSACCRVPRTSCPEIDDPILG